MNYHHSHLALDAQDVAKGVMGGVAGDIFFSNQEVQNSIPVCPY